MGLVLGSEQADIGSNEGRDGWSMGDQPFHLAAIERDREASKAVDRDCAFFGHFQGEGLGLGCHSKQGLHVGEFLFEGFVLLGEVWEDGHWRCLCNERRDCRTTPSCAPFAAVANHKIVINGSSYPLTRS